MDDGRFVVLLPRKYQHKPLGESCSQAVRRFPSLERSLQYSFVVSVMDSTLSCWGILRRTMWRQCPPRISTSRSTRCITYLYMLCASSQLSSTSKVRTVFDASAPSTTGVSLNNTLLLGSTTHSSLFDVLLRFRLYRIALTTDTSRMYQTILLDCSDKDFHHFVWRANSSQPLCDYRMTRITFGVSASSYIANVCQTEHSWPCEYIPHPLAARVVDNSFYVDDGPINNSVDEVIELQKQM